MATKKDLVEAYSFSRRRLVTAFLSGAPGGREVEPSRPGRTVVGGVLTNVARDLGARDRPYDPARGAAVDGPEVFRPLLARTATVGGVDVEHNWHGRDYTLSGYLTVWAVCSVAALLAALALVAVPKSAFSD